MKINEITVEQLAEVESQLFKTITPQQSGREEGELARLLEKTPLIVPINVRTLMAPLAPKAAVSTSIAFGIRLGLALAALNTADSPVVEDQVAS